MLTLLLLRHAKAVPQTGGDDFARVLTSGGRADAGKIGAFLADNRLIPDTALVSASVRTRETMERLTPALGRPVPVTYDKALYNATEGQLRARLGTESAATKTLLILGHNPGILDLAVALSHAGDWQEIEAMRSRFPPCSLAVITFERDDWVDASYGGGRLDAFVTPETLAAN